MIGKVRYWCLAWLCLNVAHALVPVEGIIMGVAREDIQSDPLALIFRNNYDQSDLKENIKVKSYHNTYRAGNYLRESCDLYGPIAYASNWREKQARRSVAATLQYIGLDTSIKALGSYARHLELEAEDYKRLTSNLINNYCSKNVTIFSLRNIQRSLEHYYENPLSGMVPDITSSPFVSREFKTRTQSTQARSVEFDYAIRSFRTFCSWGGDVEDYRMMSPYLRNPFIMAFVMKNLLGLKDTFHASEQKVVASPHESTVQVGCDELICRRLSPDDFKKKFPLSVGSTGLKTDLAKLYCHHFRYEDYSAANTIGEVKQWMKEAELEDPIFETNFFISLMTGVPDPIFSSEKYTELPFIAKSSIDERWNAWARDVLKLFSRDLLFEESLKVRVRPKRNLSEGFGLHFSVTLGEMDRVLDSTDKINLTFNLKLSKNYLRSLKMKWIELVNEVDLEGQKNLKRETAAYLDLQLKHKEKLFLQKMWNEDFSRLMAEELIGQIMSYQGKMFDSYKDIVLTVPIEFDYGLFALGYLRYRSDINADRLKFKF